MEHGFNLTPAWWSAYTARSIISQQITAAKNANATILRTHTPIFIWAPSGVVDESYMTQLDSLLSEAAANNLKVMLCVSHNDLTPATYASKIGYFAGRFGSRLAAVEIWNEPNLTNFFSGTASDYAAILQAAYPAVKSAYSSLKVIAPTLANADTTWLTAAYTAGIKGYFDALSIHPYSVDFDITKTPPATWRPGSTLAADLASITGVMTSFSDSSPKWITEYGYQTVGYIVPSLNTSLQEVWLKEAIQVAASDSSVQAMILYKIRDDSAIDYYGIVDHKGNNRPSYKAVQKAFGAL